MLKLLIASNTLKQCINNILSMNCVSTGPTNIAVPHILSFIFPFVLLKLMQTVVYKLVIKEKEFFRLFRFFILFVAVFLVLCNTKKIP